VSPWFWLFWGVLLPGFGVIAFFAQRSLLLSEVAVNCFGQLVGHLEAAGWLLIGYTTFKAWHIGEIWWGLGGFLEKDVYLEGIWLRVRSHREFLGNDMLDVCFLWIFLNSRFTGVVSRSLGRGKLVLKLLECVKNDVFFVFNWDYRSGSRTWVKFLYWSNQILGRAIHGVTLFFNCHVFNVSSFSILIHTL